VFGVSQSVVSERYENPSYGRWTAQTLFEIASKLNRAVFIRIVDFETFLKLSDDMSDDAAAPIACDEASLNAALERVQVEEAKQARKLELRRLFNFNEGATQGTPPFAAPKPMELPEMPNSGVELRINGGNAA
jgi:hypothetical protein